MTNHNNYFVRSGLVRVAAVAAVLGLGACASPEPAPDSFKKEYLRVLEEIEGLYPYPGDGVCEYEVEDVRGIKNPLTITTVGLPDGSSIRGERRENNPTKVVYYEPSKAEGSEPIAIIAVDDYAGTALASVAARSDSGYGANSPKAAADVIIEALEVCLE